MGELLQRGRGGEHLRRDVERRVLILKEAGLVKQGQGRVLALVWVRCVGTGLRDVVRHA